MVNRYLYAMKRFYLLNGFIISLFLGLTAYMISYREETGFDVLVFTGSFISAFLSWLLVQLVIQQRRPRNYGWKGFIAIVGCVVISFLLFYVMQCVVKPHSHAAGGSYMIAVIYLLLFTRGVINGGFLYYISYLLQMAAINQQSKLENERLKKESLKARLLLLQEQVSPHFLFNSLGTLRSMVSEKAPREFIQNLAEVYRYLLNNRQADWVALKTELEFAKAYLHILQQRFENALVVDIAIAETYLTMKLPPMTLQLLIENAVKHNILDMDEPLRLKIEAVGDNKLIICNSLRPKKTLGDSTGTGLNNIRERYRLLADWDIEVLQTSTEFIVSVYLSNGTP